MSELINMYLCARDEREVYIGRGGPWGNPFVIGKDGDRDAVIEKYRQYLWGNAKLMTLICEGALTNRKLACYCAPRRCHGEVLLAALKWVEANE